MKIWEYKIVTSIKEVNEYAKEGWEAISHQVIAHNPNGMTTCFPSRNNEESFLLKRNMATEKLRFTEIVNKYCNLSSNSYRIASNTKDDKLFSFLVEAIEKNKLGDKDLENMLYKEILLKKEYGWDSRSLVNYIFCILMAFPLSLTIQCNIENILREFAENGN